MCQNIKTAVILLYADKSSLKKYWKDKVIAYQENYENSKVHRIV